MYAILFTILVAYFWIAILNLYIYIMVFITSEIVACSRVVSMQISIL